MAKTKAVSRRLTAKAGHAPPILEASRMPDNILILHSASVIRVELGIVELQHWSNWTEPTITLFSRRDPIAESRFRAHPLIRRVVVRQAGWRWLADWIRLRRERFDTVVVFLTGETGYGKMQWLAGWLGARRILAHLGDGQIVALPASAYYRFLRARRRAPRPMDFLRFQDDPPELPAERVLALQSAPPELVAEGLRRLQAQRIFRQPEITLFAREKAAGHPVWNSLAPMPQIITHAEGVKALEHLRRVRAGAYDALVLFLTGDPSYRKIKAFALLCGVRRILIFNENLDCFFFSARTYLQFLKKRMRYGVARPLIPPAAEDGFSPDRVLVLQSAEPEVMAPILDGLRGRKLFHNPQLTLFLRHSERTLEYFAGCPFAHQVKTHTRAERALSHLREMRRQRYDAVVLFLTGDPSYWKMKYFAFLCGAPRLLIFNEHGDCFFFTPLAFLHFLFNRWRQPLGGRETSPDATLLTALIAIVKPLVFPFRFIYLLLYYWILQVGKPR